MNTCLIQNKAFPLGGGRGQGIASTVPRRYFTSKGIELSPENLAMMKQINESESNYFLINRRSK